MSHGKMLETSKALLAQRVQRVQQVLLVQLVNRESLVRLLLQTSPPQQVQTKATLGTTAKLVVFMFTMTVSGSRLQLPQLVQQVRLVLLAQQVRTLKSQVQQVPRVQLASEASLGQRVRRGQLVLTLR